MGAGKCFFETNCFDRVDDDYYYCDVCRKKQEYKKSVKEIIFLREQVSYLKHKINKKNQVIDFWRRQLEFAEEQLTLKTLKELENE